MMSGVAETDQDPMTVDQMRELQRQGWEFGSEMKTHSQTADLSEEEVREEVRDSKQWLVENEFIGNVPAITYPYGSHDETVLDITAGYYGMGRIVDDTLNRATLTNPLHISGHSVYSDNISRTKELIDLAVKHNQTAVLNFHGLDEYGWQPGGEMSSSDFREVLEYLYNKGPSSIPTVSYSNWWNNLDQLHSNV
ncbi:Polysaccharide deacetylase domain-containing protein [Halalkalicoccus jeotgali B3]|uniref:Polysaccharide deacetylase domain-containing protein n=2 Tax=Halalkalicoccus jeotgali TaxID=413810 RepID=L9VP66_HALJB|nr:Polysaccharide deacetylase domain-containing protein [Halalkalicoccus jeotgali B3]